MKTQGLRVNIGASEQIVSSMSDLEKHLPILKYCLDKVLSHNRLGIIAILQPSTNSNSNLDFYSA